MINAELSVLKEFLQAHGEKLDDYEVWGQDNAPPISSQLSLGDLRAIYAHTMKLLNPTPIKVPTKKSTT